MDRKSEQKYKSCGDLEGLGGRCGARGAGRYGIIWLRNLRSKLFKLFCCTYLVKRVIELTSEI